MKITEFKQIKGGWTKLDEAQANVGEYQEKIQGMIAGQASFILIANTEFGEVQARAMSLKAFEGIKYLWFATHRSSEHLALLLKNPVCSVFFNDINTYSGLMLSGKAIVETDRERMQRCWRDFYKDTFPQGLDDPEFTAVRIEVEKGNFSFGGSSVSFINE